MIVTRIVQGVLVGAAMVGVFQMVKAARRGSFLIVFMTARLVLAMPFSDIPLFEAGQTQCPVNPYNMAPEVIAYAR